MEMEQPTESGATVFIKLLFRSKLSSPLCLMFLNDTPYQLLFKAKSKTKLPLSAQMFFLY